VKAALPAAAAAAAALLGAAAAGSWPALWGSLAVLAGCAYAGAIFVSRDLYPLHFMRHQFYFLLPYVVLFSAAASALWRIGRGPAAERLRWAALAVFACGYLLLNWRAAAVAGRGLRTNDIEWGLFLEASRGWPKGCYALYPAWDNRGLLLRKYFPAMPDDFTEMPDCFLKYVPPQAAAFSQAGGEPQSYNPFSPSYREGGEPVFERRFAHKFNTIFSGLEPREEIRQRAGFYRAETAGDRAWLLNERGMFMLRHQELGRAAGLFREAVKTEPSCEVCRLNLAAALVFSGRRADAKKELADPRCRPSSVTGLRLARGLASASAGLEAEAEADFAEAAKASRSGVFPVMASTYLHLLMESRLAK